MVAAAGVVGVEASPLVVASPLEVVDTAGGAETVFLMACCCCNGIFEVLSEEARIIKEFLQHGQL